MATGYSPKIVTDGLVLALDAANTKSYPGTGTNWKDLSGNGYNGTLTNSPTYNSDFVGHINLDGANDHVVVSSWDNSGTVQSVEMWSRWRSGAGHMFVGFTTYDIWTSNSHLGFNTGNSDVYGISSTQVSNLNLVGTSQSNWHHYIFEFTTQIQNNKIFIDGIEQVLSQQLSTTNLTNGRSFSSSFQIGSWNNSDGYYFTGDISTFRIYKKSLTAAEIQQNYNATKGRFGL